MSSELATAQAPKTALSALAARLEIDPDKMAKVLKATVFKACKTDEQFAALLIVSNTYGLNPLTKEIYAFPGKGGEIVPVVSIDGWLRIINSHPQMDGMSDAWAEDGSWCEVTIYRKDRTHPTVHREYYDEVKRSTEPWKQHRRRMTKWKTIIQTGRIAFGFGGIHDEDEGFDAAGMRNVNDSAKVVDDAPADENPFERIAADYSKPAPAEVIDTEKPAKERPEGELIRATFLEKSSKKGTTKGKPWTRHGFKLASQDGELWAGTFSGSLGALDFREGLEVEVIIEKKGEHFELLWIEEAPARKGGLV